MHCHLTKNTDRLDPIFRRGISLLCSTELFSDVLSPKNISLGLSPSKTNQALLHSFNFLGPYQKILPELGLSLGLSQIVDTEPSKKTLTTLLARAWLGSWPITRAVLQYWHPICLCPEDPKVNRRLTTQYHFISRPFEIFFWRSLIGQWELFFPTILKMTASGRVHSKSHFSAHEWTSGIDFTLGGQQLSLPTVLTYYSVWNSLKHHWCQSTFDLTLAWKLLHSPIHTREELLASS